MPRLLPLLLLGLALLVGCGEPNQAPRSITTKKDMAKKEGPRQEALSKAARQDAERGRKPAGGKAGAVGGEDEAAEDVKRKVLFNGRMQLQTADFDATMNGLEALIDQLDGYVARSEERNSPDAQRQATLLVRVPAAKLPDFRKRAAKLGEVQVNLVDSEDVTEAYYDLREEMLNLEAEEKALRVLLERAEKNAATKTSEVIEVRRELARVRGEINVRKGRLKRWDRLSDFATMNLEITERTAYKPEDAPPLGTRLWRGLSDSLSALGTFGEGLLFVLVVLLPWAVPLGLVGLVVVLVARSLAGKGQPPAPPRPSEKQPVVAQLADDPNQPPPSETARPVEG
jgi:hypothetical protein